MKTSDYLQSDHALEQLKLHNLQLTAESHGGRGSKHLCVVGNLLAQSCKNEIEKSLLQKYLIGPNKLSMILDVITPSTFGVFFSTHISICLE